MMRRCLVSALVAASGCSTRIEPLREQVVDLPPLPSADGPPTSLLICRFADLRGDTYHRSSPTSWIPVVNWFYSGQTYHYPDEAGVTGRSRRRGPVIGVGALDTALPDLLAATIQRARPQWHIEVTASRDRCDSGGDAAYVIDGKLRRTELTIHGNFLPMQLFALLGSPMFIVEFTGELDVEVRRADTGKAAWSHTFTAAERRAMGLYYNHKADHALFWGLVRDAVQQTSTGAILVAERGR